MHRRNQLPPMRSEHGDVVVQLSCKKYDHLLLHSFILAKNIPFLAAPLVHEGWERQERLSNSATGQERQVYRFGLKLVDDAIILEGKSFDAPDILPGKGLPDFQDSSYASGWPETDNQGCLKYAVQAHKALFALLYGYPLSLGALGGWGEYPTLDHMRPPPCIARIGAYAEYYGCMDRVAPMLENILLQDENIWSAICRHPLFYLAELAHEFDSDEKDLEQQFEPHLEALEAEKGHLVDELRRLQLHQSTFRYERDYWTVRTSFLSRLAFRKPDKSDQDKLRTRIDWYARSIYGQWLMERFVGDALDQTFWGKPRPAFTGGLRVTCRELLRAAKWKNPSNIFGKDSAMRFADVFEIDGKEAQRGLKGALDQIVRNAANVVDSAFRTVKVFESDGTMLTFRQNQIPGNGEPFTYLPLEEKDVPWQYEVQWEECAELPIVKKHPTSNKTLRLMGMLA